MINPLSCSLAEKEQLCLNYTKFTLFLRLSSESLTDNTLIIGLILPCSKGCISQVEQVYSSVTSNFFVRVKTT